MIAVLHFSDNPLLNVNVRRSRLLQLDFSSACVGRGLTSKRTITSMLWRLIQHVLLVSPIAA